MHPKFKLPLGHLNSSSGEGFKIKLQNTGRDHTLDNSLSSIESYSLESDNNAKNTAGQQQVQDFSVGLQAKQPESPALVLLDADKQYRKFHKNDHG